MANMLSSTKEPASAEGKQVTFNPNPVTIPTSAAAETPTTTRDKATEGLSNGSTATEPISSIKGTIPITDMTDPTRVKNVLVSSVVPLPVGGDHTYAKTTPTTDEGEDSSSSSDSSSESDTDTEPEKPTDDSGPRNMASNGTPLTVNPPSALISPVDTPTTTPTPKKRGRPRKNPATPQSVPLPKKTKTNNKTEEPPLRSILKLGSAPNTPVSKSSDANSSNAKKNIRRRGRGCGSCVGCVREDCGKCLYCLDKPKYGGPGRKKQRCALRSCSQFVSVGKRLPACYMNKMPDTPKTAAILTVAQHLVAAAAANNENQSIPLATPIQQALEPSPVQQETPIIKLTEETFLEKTGGISPVVSNDTLAALILASSESAPLTGSSSSNKVPAVSQETAALTSLLASTSTPGRVKPLDPDSMKCVVCTRERKIKLAKTDKFCTLRCMKAWTEQNPGKNPDSAEPGETKNLLCMPPTTAIADQPRAIKKLMIDMALPGTQPFLPPSSSPPKSINLPPVGPPVAATSTSNILTSTNLLTAISTPPVSSINSPAGPVINSGGGVKRQLPTDDTNQSVKKFKEASLTLTSATKTTPTTSVAKTTSAKTGAAASNRRRGPNVKGSRKKKSDLTGAKAKKRNSKNYENRKLVNKDLPVDVSKWAISDVKKFFESKPDCQPVLSLLEDQEIDGQALLLLSQDTMVKCLNIKLGPALKIMAHVEQLKQQQATHT